MKKRSIAALALMLVVAMMLTACGGGGGAATTEIRMATGGTSGTYYAFGGIVSGVLDEKMETASVTVHSSGASKANIYEIIDGEAELALVQNDVAYYAYQGTDLFADVGAQEGFSAMAAIYAEVCQVVAT